MNRNTPTTPYTRPFAWWSTPGERAQRQPTSELVITLDRQPFARPKPSVGVALQKAEILPFTGSNTPYESHE